MISIVTLLITAHEPPSNTTKESVLRIRTKRILNLLSPAGNGAPSQHEGCTHMCLSSIARKQYRSIFTSTRPHAAYVCVCAVAKIIFLLIHLGICFTSIQLCSSTYRRPHACMNASMQADRKPRLYVRIYVPVQISMCMCVHEQMVACLFWVWAIIHAPMHNLPRALCAAV